MEPTTQTTTTAAVQGFGEALKNAPIESPATTAPAAAPAAAPTVPATEPVEAASAQPPKPKDSQTGLMRAAQAERAKRQAAERERDEARQALQQFQGGYAPQEQHVPAEPVVDQRVENRLLTISEQSARAAHPDFDEKFVAFQEHAVDPVTGELTPLGRQVLASDHPGEVAYQFGRNAMIQKKYGSDPDGMIKAIREETEKDLREKLRAEITAEVSGKIHSKNLTPTDITAGGAAGGDNGKPSPIGFAHVLGRKKGR